RHLVAFFTHKNSLDNKYSCAFVKSKRDNLMTSWALNVKVISRMLLVISIGCLMLIGNGSLFASQGFSGKPILLASNNTFIFSPRTLVWKAINENGKVVKSGMGSGGMHYCSDIRRSCRTPVGVFRIISKGG